MQCGLQVPFLRLNLTGRQQSQIKAMLRYYYMSTRMAKTKTRENPKSLDKYGPSGTLIHGCWDPRSEHNHFGKLTLWMQVHFSLIPCPPFRVDRENQVLMVKIHQHIHRSSTKNNRNLRPAKMSIRSRTATSMTAESAPRQSTMQQRR